MKESKFPFLSSFFIKVFALLFMTFDHVGLLLRTSSYNYDVLQLSNVFRTIGRLALPLFVFMIVEGVIHTKHFGKYALRLGIMATFITIVLIIIAYADFGFDTSSIAGAGNIFLDLILVALAIFLLKHPNKLIKLLVILPIGLSVLSFVVKGYENAYNATIHWYPTWLYLQYDWFSMLLGILFYLSYKVGDIYISVMKNQFNVDEAYWEIAGHKRFLINIIQVFSLCLVSVFYYCFKYMWPGAVFWDVETQLFAMLSGVFILLYNGKRGYNAKWFQYGSYLYYPLHLGIIILIFIILNGGF